MFRTIKKAIPASAKVRIVNFLHVVVGRPVVSAMRERALALEQVFDQRLSRLEATVQRIENTLSSSQADRDKGLDTARKALLTRQDLLISILEQRLAGLESRLENSLAAGKVPETASPEAKPQASHVNGNAKGVSAHS